MGTDTVATGFVWDSSRWDAWCDTCQTCTESDDTTARWCLICGDKRN